LYLINKQQIKHTVMPGNDDHEEEQLNVSSLDGTRLLITMSTEKSVKDLRHEVAVLHEVPQFAIDLFVLGCEDPLVNEQLLKDVGGSSLFMLLKLASDRLFLEYFFQSTCGEGWRYNVGWDDPATEIDKFRGVKTDSVNGRVTRITLFYNNLSGSIPNDIQQLSALQYLNLEENQLTGSIPANLGQLTALTEIYMERNKLTGPIPAEIGQLKALTHLSLYANQLTGSIPAQLGQMRSLTNLQLNNNQLTGSIPSELGQLEGLTHLFLAYNHLTGSIPTELGKLVALTEFIWCGNDLEGSIPEELNHLN